jgi:hypothetical protein
LIRDLESGPIAASDSRQALLAATCRNLRLLPAAPCSTTRAVDGSDTPIAAHLSPCAMRSTAG